MRIITALSKRGIIGLVLMLVVLAAPLLAQQTVPDGFVPMDEMAPREVLPATPLVFYAYSFVWLVLIAYVFSIWKRMSKVEQDLAEVQRRLKDSQGGR